MPGSKEILKIWVGNMDSAPPTAHKRSHHHNHTTKLMIVNPELLYVRLLCENGVEHPGQSSCLSWLKVCMIRSRPKPCSMLREKAEYFAFDRLKCRRLVYGLKLLEGSTVSTVEKSTNGNGGHYRDKVGGQSGCQGMTDASDLYRSEIDRQNVKGCFR